MEVKDDILPGLLEIIENEFEQRTVNSEKLKKAMQALTDKKATYADVNEYAIETGEILADVFKSHLTAAGLPDGKMYFNIAGRLLNPTLAKNHELITGYAADVQTELNHAAGLGIKGQTAELNQDRIDGLVEKISDADNFEDVEWLLQEPIVNYSQSIVDAVIKANVVFHAKVGLQPQLRRTLDGRKACKWCKSLAGIYDYPDVPDDVYRRHARCKCTVGYNPKNGRGIQNSHSKVWNDPEKDAKIEARKQIGLKVESGAKNYIRDDSKDFLKSEEVIKQDKFAYKQYDAIKNRNQDIEKRKIYSNIGQFKSMKDFSKADVDIAFNHVFNDIHELEKGRALFDPDYDMAQSWTRLSDGKNIKNHDLVLLRHERLEHDYMYVTNNLNYRDAHDETVKLFDYVTTKEEEDSNGNIQIN